MTATIKFLKSIDDSANIWLSDKPALYENIQPTYFISVLHPIPFPHTPPI